MYKKVVFIIFSVLVLEVKSNCDGYFECFNSFLDSFFANSDDVEYVNTTSKNLPENYVQVKDVKISELQKTLSDISSFIQQDISHQLEAQANAAVFTNLNPKTKIYVKTFNYNSEDGLPNFENFNFGQDTFEQNEEIQNVFTPTPQTTTKSVESKIKNQQVSENEISKSDDDLSYYDLLEDNATDYPIIDYIELYKDTTNEENVYEVTEIATGLKDEIKETQVEYIDGMEKLIWDVNITEPSENVSAIFPWISSVFLKNDSQSNQFEYFCDGALLNEQLLITAARCVNLKNGTVAAADLLVILGKRSLVSMAGEEQMFRVKQIVTHENFTNEAEKVENDLAILILDKLVVFNEKIQPAYIGNGTEAVEKSFTTAWNLQGDLVPVSLENKPKEACKEKIGDDMFCAAYGLDVALCPSYGGIIAGQHGDSWSLYGIRSGDATQRGLCFDKYVQYTDLRMFDQWIAEYM